MTLWLIGMMGSGKTTAGRRAAALLEVEFADTDEVVAQRMGCSVAQLWGSLGEGAFRDLEKVATAELAGREAIVATGGGVVLDDSNRQLMSASGEVVWLRGSPGVLANRIGPDDRRPLLSTADVSRRETLERILTQRAPLYESVSSHWIDTDSLTIEEVALRLVDIWHG